MSGQQKRGFRLPWAADRAPVEGAAGAATIEPPTPDPTNGVVSEDLGDGPFRRAGASPLSTEDAVPAESDVPEVTAEAAMIETQSTESPATEDGSGPARTDWPEVDRRSSPQHALDAEQPRPPIRAEGEARPPRRDNPLVAGLVKAMREAAIASRDETLARLHAEAGSRVENIRTRATSEAAELRKRAENDVTDIREWSKAEIARIRQQTEDRIEARRSELAGETERHAASVERLVADVQTVVEAFEADMESFFQRLLSEDDPARLAALAEQAPDAPDLTGDGPAALDLGDDHGDLPAVRGQAAASPQAAGHADGAAADEPDDEQPLADEAVTDEAVIGEAVSDQAVSDEVLIDEPVSDDPVADEPVAEVAAVEEPSTDDATVDAPTNEALEADAAAAAEVAATEGLDLGAGTEWPAAVLSAARRSEPNGGADATAGGATRLHVSGLTSVAGISALKGALGQLPGVHSVSVSSGERGVFVFAVHHDPSADLASGLAGLPGFAARVTDANGDDVSVVAHEPAA